MRAITITEHGGVEGICLGQVVTPAAPTVDRVRVRVHAAGLNRADILQRRGKYPAPTGYSQNVPGLEFAGEVEAIGEAVRLWNVGDRVFGITAGGAQAEFVVVPESNLARVPDNLNWAEAGAIPEVFITAHDALFTRAGLQVGERVLIHAAGSGVGTAAVQLAHAAGAIVYGTSRTTEKLTRLREFGLDYPVVLGDDPTALVGALQQLTNGASPDVVIDLVGGAYFPVNLEVLAPGGRIVCVGTTAGAISQVNIGMIMRKRAVIVGTVLRARSTDEKAEAVRRFAAQVLPLIARGQVRPVVEAIYAPEEIRAAHKHMESNRAFGKIVITFS
ncbi:MAG: NAD(P)H-quinone oxidoreductase [Chthoniobacterales bacterium]